MASLSRERATLTLSPTDVRYVSDVALIIRQCISYMGFLACLRADETLPKTICRDNNDHASRFIEECSKVEVGAATVGARDLKNIFSRWSVENRFDDLVSGNIFSRRMEERRL